MATGTMPNMFVEAVKYISERLFSQEVRGIARHEFIVAENAERFFIQVTMPAGLSTRNYVDLPVRFGARPADPNQPIIDTAHTLIHEMRAGIDIRLLDQIEGDLGYQFLICA